MFPYLNVLLILASIFLIALIGYIIMGKIDNWTARQNPSQITLAVEDPACARALRPLLNQMRRRNADIKIIIIDFDQIMECFSKHQIDLAVIRKPQTSLAVSNQKKITLEVNDSENKHSRKPVSCRILWDDRLPDSLLQDILYYFHVQ